MAAAQAAAALAAHGVDLIDEDDGRSLLLGLLEQVTDAAGTHAHIHLHKIGAGDGQEGGVRLAGHGLGQQRLAGARRAHQQHALGNMRAQLGIALGIAQKLDDLLQLLLLLIGTGHVLERDLLAVRGDILDTGLAEAGHFIVDGAAAQAAHTGDQVHQQDEGHGRQHIGQQGTQPAVFAAGGVVIAGDDALFRLGHHQIVHVVIKRVEAVEGAADAGAVLQLRHQARVGGGEGLDLLRREIGAHIAVAHVAGTAEVAHHLGDEHHRQHNEQQHDAAETFSFHVSPSPFSADPADALPALVTAHGDGHQHPRLDSLHRDIGLAQQTAVVGAGAVVAHDEHTALRHGEDLVGHAVRQGGDALGGQVALVQLLTVDVGIAVLEGERLTGQADDALHQDLVQLLVPEGDDVAAVRHRIGHHIGQPPADQQALGGDGGLHGAAGHIGQLQQHLEQHEHRRQRHQQVAVVVPQSAAAAFGGLGRRGRRLRRGGCGALRGGGLLRGDLYLVGRGGRRCGFHRLAGGGQALSAFVFHILHFLLSNRAKAAPRVALVGSG